MHTEPEGQRLGCCGEYHLHLYRKRQRISSPTKAWAKYERLWTIDLAGESYAYGFDTMGRPATMASPTSGPPTAKWINGVSYNEAGLPPAITAGNSNVAGESGEYSALGQLRRIVSGAHELCYNFNDTANDGRVVSQKSYLGSFPKGSAVSGTICR